MADPKPATMAARAADAFADHGPAWPLSALNLRVGRRRHGRPLRRLLLHREPDRRHRGWLMVLMDKVEQLGGSVNALEFIQKETEESAISFSPPIKEALRAGGSIGEVCAARC